MTLREIDILTTLVLSRISHLGGADHAPKELVNVLNTLADEKQAEQDRLNDPLS
jgi:hypothetical protein